MDIDVNTRGKENKTFKQIIEEHNKFREYMRKCSCSHTMLFTGKKDRLICSHCGRYVYKDDLTKLKYKMKELLK